MRRSVGKQISHENTLSERDEVKCNLMVCISLLQSEELLIFTHAFWSRRHHKHCTLQVVGHESQMGRQGSRRRTSWKAIT
jgi:hypothetical protein